MVSVPVQCPHCQSTEVIKAASKPTGPNAIGRAIQVRLS